MTLEIQPDEARRIARDAFVFGFPFATNYRVFISEAVQRSPIGTVALSDRGVRRIGVASLFGQIA